MLNLDTILGFASVSCYAFGYLLASLWVPDINIIFTFFSTNDTILLEVKWMICAEIWVKKFINLQFCTGFHILVWLYIWGKNKWYPVVNWNIILVWKSRILVFLKIMTWWRLYCMFEDLGKQVDSG